MKPEEVKRIRGNLTRKTFCDKLNEISKIIEPREDVVKFSERSIIKYERGEREPAPWQEFIITIFLAKKYDFMDNTHLYELSQRLESAISLQSQDN